MPESNGKTNWTAILHRGDVTEGITIDQSEYPDRTRYEADRMRWMIGELAEEPWVLDYDADKHSGYVAAGASNERADAEKDAALTDKQIESGWRHTFSTDNPYCPCNLKSFTKAVRWAEHAILAAKEKK
jgi:hypothetical protein